MIPLFRTWVLAALVAGSAQAEGLDLSAADRAAFDAEVRAALLADPTPVIAALRPEAAQFSEEAAADRALLDQLAPLFQPTERGIGSDSPRITLVVFDRFPCPDCARSWQDLTRLVQDIPDLRVEPRFAEATGPAQLLLSLLDREGPDAYHAARLKLLAAPDEDAMAQVLTENRWIQDRMLRPAPEMEAQAFAALDLDVAPSYVLPGLILRGAMPAIVLEKHLRP